MFCVVTAPIPARAYAHRAATAGDDEATAAANRPVDAHRAAIENVISASRPQSGGDPGRIPAAREFRRQKIRMRQVYLAAIAPAAKSL
jgi:hypothetical protein